MREFDEARVTHADAVGVLSNLEMLERVGISTRAFWHALGIDPIDVKQGVRVPWDAYARFLERAFEEVGEDAVDAAAEELSRQFETHFPAQPSSRSALQFVVAELVPALWPCLRAREVELPAPLFCVRVEIPSPLHAFAKYHRMNARALAGAPRGMSAAPASLVRVLISDDARTAHYLYEFADEVVEPPIEPASSADVDAIGVLTNTEMLERVGIDTRPYWSSLGVDPSTLTGRRAVSWDAHASFFEEAVSRAGLEACVDVARDLSSQFSAHFPRPSSARAALDFVAHEVVPNVWMCLRTRVLDLPPPLWGLRMEIPPPLRSAPAFLHLSAVGLEGGPRAMAADAAKLLRTAIDPTGRAAVILLELTDESPSPSEPSTAPREQPVDEADAGAVLTHVEFFERLGVPSRSFKASLGIDSLADMRRGARVPWNAFARFIETAIAQVGEHEATSAMRELARRPQTDWPAQPSSRAALAFVAEKVMPAVWPCLRTRFVALPEPLCAITVEVPAPLHTFEALHRLTGAEIAGVPAAFGHPTPAHVGTVIDATVRRAVHVFRLADEGAAPPLGPLGDTVRGRAFLGFYDICELSGVDVRAWGAEQGVDRAALLEDHPVGWSSVCALFHRAGRSIDQPQLDDAARRFADLTASIGTTVSPHIDDPFALIEMLHSVPFVEDAWGPLGPATAARIDDRLLVARIALRAGVADCELMFRMQGSAIAVMTRLLDLSPLVLRASLITAREGVYVLELPGPAPSTPTASTSSGASSALASAVVDGVYRERIAARASIIERLGRLVSRTTDVRGIADVLAHDLREHLDATGVELALVVEDAQVPVHIQGERDGSLVTRAIEFDGETLGSVRVWTEPRATGAILAVLDVIMPWIGIAFGTALQRARASTSIAEARSAQAAVEVVLGSILERHPCPVFMVDASGALRAANAFAEAALIEDTERVLGRIATALDRGDDDAVETHTLMREGVVDRVIVIERNVGAPTAEGRARAAAASWKLTRRQSDVLLAVARGLSNKEIAAELGCAEVTVENHLTGTFRKAGVSGRAQLVAKMWKR